MQVSQSLFAEVAQRLGNTSSSSSNSFLSSTQVHVTNSDSSGSDDDDDNNYKGKKKGKRRRQESKAAKPRITKSRRVDELSTIANQLLEHYKTVRPEHKVLQLDDYDRLADCARGILKIKELLQAGKARYGVCCRLEDLIAILDEPEDEGEDEELKTDKKKEEAEEEQVVMEIAEECSMRHDPNGLAVLLANNNHERSLALFLRKFLPFVHLVPLNMCDIWYVLFRAAFRKFERKRKSDLLSSIKIKEQDRSSGDHWHNEKLRMMLDPLPKSQITVVLEEDPPRGQAGRSAMAALENPSDMYVLRALESHSQERDGINFRQRGSFLDTALMIILDCESNLRFGNRFVESQRVEQREVEENKQPRLHRYETQAYQMTDPSSVVSIARPNSKHVAKTALEIHGHAGTGIAKFGDRPRDLLNLPSVSTAVMLSVMGGGEKCAEAISLKYKNMRGLVEAYQGLEPNQDAQRSMLAKLPLNKAVDPTKKRQKMTVGEALSNKVFEHLYKDQAPAAAAAAGGEDGAKKKGKKRKRSEKQHSEKEKKKKKKIKKQRTEEPERVF